MESVLEKLAAQQDLTENEMVEAMRPIMSGQAEVEDVKRFLLSLREKGEAMGFASYIAKGLIQYSTHNLEAKRLLEIFVASYERDRD